MSARKIRRFIRDCCHGRPMYCPHCGRKFLIGEAIEPYPGGDLVRLPWLRWQHKDPFECERRSCVG